MIESNPADLGSPKTKRAVGRPRKFESPEQMQDLIDLYFRECSEHDRPITITGMAVALGTTRKTLLDYERDPEFSYTVKQAKAVCERFVEEGALTGKLHATFCIFNLKNNYGWKDKVDVGYSGEVMLRNEPRTLEEARAIEEELGISS